MRCWLTVLHESREPSSLDEKYGLVPGVKYVYFTKFEKSDESNVRIIDIFR